MPEVIVLMSTVHQHMTLEERLERFKIPFRTVVKPRQLGTDCGMAIRTSSGNIEAIRKISDANQLEIHGVFLQTKGIWSEYDDKC